jgi:hypothetical protein
MFGLFVLDTLFNFRGQCVHCVAYCSTSTLAIRKESSDSSHECIILGTKKGSAVSQAQIFKRSWDSNINPARTGTSSTPRKAQNITPASLPQNNPQEGTGVLKVRSYKAEVGLSLDICGTSA